MTHQTPETIDARHAFNAAITPESIHRGMVFERVGPQDANRSLPDFFTCRGEVEAGRWIDPDYPGSFHFNLIEGVRSGAWKLHGIDPALCDHLPDITLYGVSGHARPEALVQRLVEAEHTMKWQHELLTNSENLTFGPDGIALSGHIVGMFAAAHEDIIARSEAKNFLMISFMSKKRPGTKLFVTIRYSTGKTVEDVYRETVRELATLKGENPDAVPAWAEQSGLTDNDTPAEDAAPGSHTRFFQETGDLRCSACGAVQAMQQPVRLNGISAILEDFAARHADCPKTEPRRRLIALLGLPDHECATVLGAALDPDRLLPSDRVDCYSMLQRLDAGESLLPDEFERINALYASHFQ